MNAWGDLQENLCPRCGQPLAAHIGEEPADYGAALTVCPAAQAQDTIAAAWQKRHRPDIERARKSGRDLTAGHIWTPFNRRKKAPPTWEWANPVEGG